MLLLPLLLLCQALLHERQQPPACRRERRLVEELEHRDYGAQHAVGQRVRQVGRRRCRSGISGSGSSSGGRRVLRRVAAGCRIRGSERLHAP